MAAASSHDMPEIRVANELEHYPHIMRPLPKFRQGLTEQATSRESTLWRMPLDFRVVPRFCMGYSTASNAIVDGLLEMAQQHLHQPAQSSNPIYPTSSTVMVPRSTPNQQAIVDNSSCAILPTTSRIVAHPLPSVDKIEMQARKRSLNLLKCPYCPKKCANEESLRVHRTECQIQRVHSCPQCGKRFKAKGGLQQHYRIHLNEKPYHCRFCPKQFTQKSHVDQHERIHTGAKPFICRFCNRAFRSV